MDDETAGTAVEPISDFLVAWAGQGALIIDHMTRHESPDAPPIGVVFRQLVREVLEPLADRHPSEHLAAAADVLLDAQRTLADEIFLVEAGDLDQDE